MPENTDTTTTTTTTTPVGKWFEQDGIRDKVDAEITGHWQNRGLADKTPAEVAIEMTRAHREAEKRLGVPADQLVRIPKDPADEAGMKEFYKRIGVPDTKEEYDFADIKKADGTVDEVLTSVLRDLSSSAKLPKEAAKTVGLEIKKHLDKQAKEAQDSYSAQLDVEKAELAKDWGANAAANKEIATRAAAALGVDAEAVAALEKQVGYKKVMQMFQRIGSKIGEDKFFSGENNGNGSGIMSVEQAISRKAELMADKQFVAKYQSSDAAALREMKALNVIIVEAQANDKKRIS